MTDVLQVSEETVWVPVTPTSDGDLQWSSADSPSSVKVEKGVSKLKSIEIGVVGDGSMVSGTLKGIVTSYDYKALYKVYNLKDTDSVDVWILNYKRDRSRAELKKTTETSNKVDTHVDLKYELKGNNKNITKVWVGFSVLRLKTESTQKDYSVTNASSAKGQTPDGNEYDVKFKEV